MKTFFLLLTMLGIYLSPSYDNVKAPIGFSCTPPSRQAPCHEYGYSNVVFIGTAIEVIKVDWNGEPHRYWEAHKKVVARLKVEEAVKGIEGDEVTFEMEDCPYYFSEGERYLVFAGRLNNGKLTQFSDYPTRPISEAKEAIEYIRGLKDTEPAGKIQGAVIKKASNFPAEPMSGIKIFIENSQYKFEAVTNDKGIFEFDNIPSGTYQIRNTAPSQWGIEGAKEIKIYGHGCFHALIYVMP